jgi:hypothetical protein
MRKPFRVLLLALSIFSAEAWADASANGCEHSNNRAAGCPVSMPEPSAIPVLVLCLVGLGLVAIRQQKNF